VAGLPLTGAERGQRALAVATFAEMRTHASIEGLSASAPDFYARYSRSGDVPALNPGAAIAALSIELGVRDLETTSRANCSVRLGNPALPRNLVYD
jgi:hypothetical protein